GSLRTPLPSPPLSFGCSQCATRCPSPCSLPVFSAEECSGGTSFSESHRVAACQSTETRPDDEDLVPAPALFRWVRRRRRLPLSSQARDPLLLVPDLACPAGCTRPRQHAGRCAAGAAQTRRRAAAGRRLRAR